VPRRARAWPASCAATSRAGLAPALAPGRVVLTDALPRHASGKLDGARLIAAA